jgi:hypothetical protein
MRRLWIFIWPALGLTRRQRAATPDSPDCDVGLKASSRGASENNAKKEKNSESSLEMLSYNLRKTSSSYPLHTPRPSFTMVNVPSELSRLLVSLRALHPSTRPTVHSPYFSESHYVPYPPNVKHRMPTTVVRASSSLESLGFVFIEHCPPHRRPTFVGCVNTLFHSLWISRDRICRLRSFTSGLAIAHELE